MKKTNYSGPFTNKNELVWQHPALYKILIWRFEIPIVERVEGIYSAYVEENKTQGRNKKLYRLKSVFFFLTDIR